MTSRSTVDGAERTFARLLTEVAACAGVLRAFGVGLGDRVVVGELSPEDRRRGAARGGPRRRAGGVRQHGGRRGPGAGRLERVGFAVDGDEVPWDVAMRAGRTDPAGCADVPGDAVMAPTATTC